jgi:opacity protein-like surface antigen
MRHGLAAVALILLPASVFAQGTPNTIELTPVVGYLFGDTLAKGTTSAFDFDVTIDDAPMYGLRLGYKLNESWALDAALLHERADLVTGHGELFGGASKIGEIDVTTGEIGVEGTFGHHRLVPFVAGGVGATRLDPRLAGMSADTRFTADIGAGVKLFFTPNLALRLDWRAHSVNVGDRRNDCNWWEDCAHNDTWITLREVSLGLTFVL